MLTTIIGWIWTVAGALFVWRPDWMKSWHTKRGVNHVRRVLFLTALAIGISLIGAARETGGIVGTAMIVIGVIAIVKAFLFLQRKFTAWVIALMTPWPLWIFRILAIVYVGVGVLLLSGIGRDASL